MVELDEAVAVGHEGAFLVTGVLGGPVQEPSGIAGRVRDILVEDEAWTVRYFVLAGRGLLRAPRLLLDAIEVKPLPPGPIRLGLHRSILEVERDAPPDAASARGFRVASDPTLPFDRTILAKDIPREGPRTSDSPTDEVPQRQAHLRSLRRLVHARAFVDDEKLGIVVDYRLRPDPWRIDAVFVRQGWFGKPLRIAMRRVMAADWQRGRLVLASGAEAPGHAEPGATERS